MKKFTIFMIIIDMLVAICFVVTYGMTNFRNTIIASAMSSKTHQWIAHTFYSDEVINKVLAADTYLPFDEGTNLDDVVIDTAEKSSYDNEYDEAVLTRDEGNDLYKVIDIKEGSREGKLVVIYDPSKVKLMHSKVFNQGNKGKEQVISMCQRYGAVVGINGGLFVDYGTGSDIPMGYVIKDGNIIWSDSNAPGSLVAMTFDNKLLLAQMTGDEALKAGVRDAVEFGPYLIVNGKPIQFASSENVGGYSRASRTVIAQRKDGIMFFFVTKGAIHGSNAGWTIGELVSLLQKYGAYNAANMDGGTSSTLVINNQVVNNPLNVYGRPANNGLGRYVVDGWGLIP